MTQWQEKKCPNVQTTALKREVPQSCRKSYEREGEMWEPGEQTSRECDSMSDRQDGAKEGLQL